MRRVCLFVTAWLLMVAASITVRAADDGAVSYAGKVVDADGAPLAGVEVRAFLVEFEPRMAISAAAAGKATTGADGGFAIAGEAGRDNPFGHVELIARKQGLALGWANCPAAGGADISIRLGLAQGIGGVVVDRSGEPIAGATVRGMLCFGPMTDLHWLTGVAPLDMVAARTDAQGRFSFANVPAEAKGELLVSAPGYATRCTFRADSGRLGQYAAGRTDIRLVLWPEAKLTGRVTNKDTGKPVADVRIVAASAQNPMPYGRQTVISDADGRFAIGALASSGHRLHVALDPVKHPGLAAPEAIVDLQAGETTADVAIELFPGGVIEVVVSDESKGTPVKSAQIQIVAQDSASQRFVSATTDGSGVARVSVAAGDYDVQSVYALPRYSMAMVNEPVTVVAGKTAKVQVRLAAVPKISGVVRDGAGEPVSGALVQVVPAGGESARSDAQGAFDMTWNPGWSGGGGQGMATMLVVRHTEGNLAAAIEIDPETTDSIEIKLRPGVTLTGKVAGAGGEPIANATVQVMLRGSSWSASLASGALLTTDDQGRYEVKALPADQPIAVSATKVDFGQTDVQVDLSAAVDSLIEAAPLVLQPANQTLTGSVVDEDDKPVAGAFVYVHGSGQSAQQTVTDAKGKFTVDKLCAGTVQLFANVQKPQQMQGNTSAEVGADEEVKVVVAEQGGFAERVARPARVRSLVGQKLPDLATLNVAAAGEDLAGKFVLVAFFDVRQRPSRHYLKKLAGKADALGEQGVALVVVQAAPLEAEQLDTLVAKLDLPFALGVVTDDGKKTRAAWGIKGLPAFILTDREHIVRADDFDLKGLDAKLAELAGE